MLSRHFSCLMLSVSRDGYCFIVNCIHYRSASSRNHLSHGVCVYLRMFHSFRWINATMTVVRHRLPHSLIRLIKFAIFKLCILLAMACIVSTLKPSLPLLTQRFEQSDNDYQCGCRRNIIHPCSCCLCVTNFFYCQAQSCDLPLTPDRSNKVSK